MFADPKFYWLFAGCPKVEVRKSKSLDWAEQKGNNSTRCDVDTRAPTDISVVYTILQLPSIRRSEVPDPIRAISPYGRMVELNMSGLELGGVGVSPGTLWMIPSLPFVRQTLRTQL